MKKNAKQYFTRFLHQKSRNKRQVSKRLIDNRFDENIQLKNRQICRPVKWLESNPNNEYKSLKTPSGNTYRVIQILGTDKNDYSVLEISDWVALAGDVIDPDGRISVYDGIRFTTGHKNPRDVWKELLVKFPVFVGKTDKYKFPLRGGAGSPTPVATLQVFLEIVTTLPGSIASMIREKAVRVLIRAMNGDPTLIDEILDRVTDKTQLFDLQEAINERIDNAFTGDNPVGTVQNPIEIITPELKATFIWINKVNEMTTLLGELASHVGNMDF